MWMSKPPRVPFSMGDVKALYALLSAGGESMWFLNAFASGPLSTFSLWMICISERLVPDDDKPPWPGVALDIL